MYLHVLCGIPGSGKSTLAGRLPGYYVSTDSLRKYLWGDESVIRHDRLVFRLAAEIIRYNLGAGSNVIFDATNLTVRRRRQLVLLAEEAGARVVLHWVSCPLRVAIKRNLQRQRQVPVNVITALFKSFEYPSIDEGLYMVKVYDPDKRPIKIITKKTTIARVSLLYCRKTKFASEITKNQI